MPSAASSGRARVASLVSLTIERGPHRGVARLEIRRRIGAMIDLLQLQNTEISFVLTDNRTIHKLNREYRHIDRPTDVLAFALREGEFAALAGAALGDVVVSVQQARKQAEERGVTVVEEVTMLLAHGLLHLLGWDHDTPAKDRRMRKETERLCIAARPVEHTGAAAKRPSARSAGRSKGGQRGVLSRYPAPRDRVRDPRKVEGPQQVKARRSRKG